MKASFLRFSPSVSTHCGKMQVVNKEQMSLHQIACYFWGLLLYTSITPILTSKPSGTHKMKRFKRLLIPDYPKQ
jgi:hypothetical protein